MSSHVHLTLLESVAHPPVPEDTLVNPIPGDIPNGDGFVRGNFVNEDVVGGAIVSVRSGGSGRKGEHNCLD